MKRILPILFLFLMRNSVILVLFAVMPHPSVFAKEGLLNSSYEEVAARPGKRCSHDKAKLSGIRYNRYHFETRGWKAAVPFTDGKAQHLDTEKGDGSLISAQAR